VQLETMLRKGAGFKNQLTSTSHFLVASHSYQYAYSNRQIPFPPTYSFSSLPTQAHIRALETAQFSQLTEKQLRLDMILLRS